MELIGSHAFFVIVVILRKKYRKARISLIAR